MKKIKKNRSCCQGSNVFPEPPFQEHSINPPVLPHWSTCLNRGFSAFFLCWDNCKYLPAFRRGVSQELLNYSFSTGLAETDSCPQSCSCLAVPPGEGGCWQGWGCRYCGRGTRGAGNPGCCIRVSALGSERSNPPQPRDFKKSGASAYQ